MITNEWINGQGDLSTAIEIRKKVFVEEQHAPADTEPDGFDEFALHLIVYVDGAAAGTGRIYHDGRYFKIGRVCVLPEYRGQHIGDLIMRLLLLKSQDFAAEVVIHAQSHAQNFYKRYGFVTEGEEFVEDGILHVKMRVKKEDILFPSECCGHRQGVKP